MNPLKLLVLLVHCPHTRTMPIIRHLIGFLISDSFCLTSIRIFMLLNLLFSRSSLWKNSLLLFSVFSLLSWLKLARFFISYQGSVNMYHLDIYSGQELVATIYGNLDDLIYIVDNLKFSIIHSFRFHKV